MARQGRRFSRRRYEVTGTRSENVIRFRISEGLDSFALENGPPRGPGSPHITSSLSHPRASLRLAILSLGPPLDKTNDPCAPIKRCPVLDLSPRNGAPRQGQCLDSASSTAVPGDCNLRISGREIGTSEVRVTLPTARPFPPTSLDIISHHLH